MGRSIIFNPLTTSRPLDVRATPQASSSKLSKADLEARLRQKRSANYIRTMTQLDAGCHCQDPRAVEALIAAIQQELPEVFIQRELVGIVAKCNLGENFEVHTMGNIVRSCDESLVESAPGLPANTPVETREILKHYRTGEPLPPLLEPARRLAVHPDYNCVEVYVDMLVAIRQNGEVSIVNI